MAQDALVARHADDVEDGQKIGGDVLAGDKGQFLVQQGLHLVGNAVGIAHGGVAPRQLFQPGLWRPIGRDRFFRVLIAEFGQIEGRARQEGGRLVHRLGRVFEQVGHFVLGLQPAFGVGLQPAAGGLDGRAFADAGQDVLKIAVIGSSVEDVVERQQRNADPLRHGFEAGQPAPVVAAPVQDGAQPDRARRRRVHAGQHLFQPCQPVRRDEDQQQAFGIGQQVAQADLALALPGAAVAQGQQARQPPPARPRLRIGDDAGRPVVEDQPRPSQQAEVRRAALHLFGQGRIVQRVFDEGDLAGTGAFTPQLGRQKAVFAQLLQRAPGPHHARDGVAVGQSHAGVAAQDRRRHHLFGMRGAAQEGEIAGGRQLGVGAARVEPLHANRPWMNQRGSGVSP
ncbi:hypothetical protein D3C73_952590 [compost metagenome]